MRRRDVLAYGLFALTAPAFAQPVGGEIVSCAIHPAIGVGRVGNSPDGWFIGPEIPGRAPQPEGGLFKDAAGRFKRQAVRYRIFGLDAAGRVVRELTSRDAEISWTAEVANTKAAWRQFHNPFDVPEAGTRRGEPYRSGLRNADVTDRESLSIRPGPRTVSGPNQRAAFDTGRFRGPVTSLGEMRTDEAGRLIMLGGWGVSRGVPADSEINQFANNDGWHDDVSDGPVDAVVRMNGRTLPVQGAWFTAAPPDYAPGLAPVVSAYDLVYATSASPSLSRRPSFAREIYPLLERMWQHQWVNAGFARDFGHGATHDFLNAATLARLADSSVANAEARKAIFRRMRDPSYNLAEERAWPPYLGDVVTGGAREFQALLPHQYAALSHWAEGDFDADLAPGGPRVPTRLEEIPIAELPGALDRAQLDAAYGGPFHPGIEFPWVIRQRGIYTAPFRLRRRAAAEPNYPAEMSQAEVLAAGGPVDGLLPGGISRWMAVPWQADFINCGSGQNPEVDPYLPTYWPAAAPNDVMTDAQYQALMAATTPEARATALAFASRKKWHRGYDADREQTYLAFLERWPQLGVVAERPAPAGGPARVWAETERSLPEEEEKPADAT